MSLNSPAVKTVVALKAGAGRWTKAEDMAAGFASSFAWIGSEMVMEIDVGGGMRRQWMN